MYLSSKISRRRLLASAPIGAGGAAAFLAAACGSSNRKPAATATSAIAPTVVATAGAARSATAAASAPAASATSGAAQPKRGGLLVQRLTSNPPSLNIWTSETNLDIFPGAPCYNQLVQFDPADPLDTKILSDLATKWEQPEDTVLTFTLQPGVKFHHGREFTSEDVVASLEWIHSAPKSSRKGVVQSIKSVEAPSKDAVRVRLAQPDASLISNLATHYGVIGPADVIAAKDGLGKELIGTGPFKLVHYLENQEVKIERNPAYHRAGLPYLDGAVFYIIPEDASAVEQFRGKRISYMVLPTAWNKSQVGDLASATKDWARIAPTPTLIRFIIFANAERSAFKDPRVRQAIGYAINRDEFRDVVQGGFGVEGAYMLPGGAWALPDADRRAIPGMSENQAEANKLLAAAGVTDLDLYLPARKDSAADAAVFLQNKLKPLGLRAKVDLKDAAAMYEVGSKGQFDLLPWPVIAGIDDPNAVFGELALSNGPRNWGKVVDPQIDALYSTQSRELDRNKRKPAVNELERQVLRNLVQIPISFRVDNNAIQTQVRDYTYHVSWFTNRRLERVWLG